MHYLPDSEAELLLKEARLAYENSYAPYSKFSVGAAVLTKDGKMFRGTNVENASYSLAICAERAALANALVNGHTVFEAIAIYAPIDSISPCGACRQFIVEFGQHIILIFQQDKKTMQKYIWELLPFAFTNTTLASGQSETTLSEH